MYVALSGSHGDLLYIDLPGQTADANGVKRLIQVSHDRYLGWWLR
jgi:hypothetical protein